MNNIFSILGHSLATKSIWSLLWKKYSSDAQKPLIFNFFLKKIYENWSIISNLMNLFTKSGFVSKICSTASQRKSPRGRSSKLSKFTSNSALPSKLILVLNISKDFSFLHFWMWLAPISVTFKLLSMSKSVKVYRQTSAVTLNMHFLEL